MAPADRVPRKVRALRAHLPLEGLRVLDVGCGEGTYLVHWPAGSLGVDRDPERVAAVRALGLAAEVRDVERPGWPAGLGRFDLIWLADLLPHLVDPGAFLRGLPPLLAPGGRVVVAEWLWPGPRLLRALALCLPGARRTYHHAEHHHRLTRAALAALLEQGGLAVEAEWVPSFRARWMGRLLSPVWPPHTVVAAPPDAGAARALADIESSTH